MVLVPASWMLLGWLVIRHMIIVAPAIGYDSCDASLCSRFCFSLFLGLLHPDFVFNDASASAFGLTAYAFGPDEGVGAIRRQPRLRLRPRRLLHRRQKAATYAVI